MAFQLILGGAFFPGSGYTATEVQEAFGRAATLCEEEIGTPSEIFRAIGGRFAVSFVGAEHSRAQEFAARLVEIGVREGSDALLVDAYLVTAANSYWQGLFPKAQQYCESAVSRYRPGQTLVNIPGADSVAIAFGYASHALWQLGYPDRAFQMRSRVFERIAGQSHPYTTVMALSFTAGVRALRRDREALGEASALVALCEEHGFPYYQCLAQGFRDGTAVEYGGAADEIEPLSSSIDRLRKYGSRLQLCWLTRALAAAYLKTGEVEHGLRTVTDALAEVDETGERESEAEFLRLRGELLLLTDDHRDQAEASFRAGIEVARGQSGKSWELRATTSLARLLMTQGRRDEARAMLADIYNWFTEGFDTADLKDAKALLDELHDA